MYYPATGLCITGLCTRVACYFFPVLVKFRPYSFIRNEVTTGSDWIFKGFAVQLFADVKCIFFISKTFVANVRKLWKAFWKTGPLLSYRVTHYLNSAREHFEQFIIVVLSVIMTIISGKTN
jgi:hypothetical protein